MGVWLKVTGQDPALRWARGLCIKDKALREEFDGGFFASFGKRHLSAIVRCFQGWKLKVEILDGPPVGEDTHVVKKPRPTRLKNPRLPSRGKLRVFSESRLVEKDPEVDIEIFGTTVSDIRAIAHSHSKGEVAELLGVTPDKMSYELSSLEIDPIYFGYLCKKCSSSFQGKDAFDLYRSHVLLCK